MTKKTTRRALLASIVSLVLCFTMLIGTTFAWFTDSVTSGKNKIVAGNLDIELEYTTTPDVETSWKSVKGASDLLDPNALWEPGHTEVVYLRISNLGTLSLKYRFTMNVYDKVIGKSVLGNDIDLSDYLEYGVVDYTAKFATRDEARKAVTAPAKLDDYSASGEMKKGDPAKVIALVVYMPTEVGNEANYVTGTTPPSIELGVELFATQLMDESDSFGNNYDDIALVSDAGTLKDAIDAGKNVMLTKDVALDANATVTVPVDAKIILDLNGHDIIAESTEVGKNRAAFTVKGEMSVIGEGVISSVHTAANMSWSNLSAPFSVEGGVLTLGKDVTVLNLGGTDMAYAVDVNTTLGESTLNVNGATLVSSYIAVRIFNNHSTEKGIVNYNSGIIQGNKNGYDIWAQLMNDPAENAVVNIADGISYTTEDKSGTMYYIESDVTVASTPADLANALTSGGNIVLTSDVKLGNEALAVAAGQEVVIDLNGKTLSTVNTDAKASAAINNKGTLTLKNGTVTYKGVGDPNFGYGTNTIHNTGKLVIDGATIINTTDVGSSVAIDCAAGAELIVNNGVIKSVKNAIRLCPFGGAAINCTINGGVITGSRAIQIQLPSNNPADAPEINLTINGGEFNSTSDLAIYSYSAGQSFDNVNVSISGGTFNGDVQFGGGSAKTTTENVTITGGTFNGYLGRWLENNGWQDIVKP